MAGLGIPFVPPAYGYGSVPIPQDAQPPAPQPPPVDPNYSPANAAGRLIGNAISPSQIAAQATSRPSMYAPVIGGIGNFFRGVVGRGPAPTAPAPEVAPAGPLPGTSPMGQGGVGSDAGIPIKAAPPAPARQGFNRLSLASAAAIAAFLPRQRTPQEVGGQEYMSALQNQRDSILNDASKTDAQKSAATQAYMTGLERIIQLNQAGILNAETQGFGVPP